MSSFFSLTGAPEGFWGVKSIVANDLDPNAVAWCLRCVVASCQGHMKKNFAHNELGNEVQVGL